MSGFHRFLRAITRHYRLPFGDAWFNDRIDRFFRNREPQWLLAPAAGAWPTMELDLTQKLQRKFFFFPKLHGWYYGRLPFRAFLTERLTPGSTFLDIGSNVGFFSLLAARLVGPTGRVYSFEPDPDICEALRRSAQANGYTHLRTHQLALSDEVGELTFYRAKDGTANSLVPEARGREARYERTLKTPVTTLDKLVADGTIDPRGIKAIKVDVEGAEPRTVAGMLEALRAADYPAIWCEVRGPRGSTRAPNTYGPVRDTLATIGYRPYFWKAGERRPVDEAEVVKRTDILFEKT